ncbi:MAG: LptF/LptG family permease [Gemmatimonadota bacterium]
MIFRILDRYVLGQWLRIFILTAVGFPLVSVLIQATDKLSRLLDRQLAPGTIALSFLYAIPEEMSRMIPAASLFAMVFTIGPLGRNSELTAAKAGGLSFHRIIRPLVMASALASVLSYGVSHLATRASARAIELQQEKKFRDIKVKYNFVYRADQNWVYSIRLLDTEMRRMDNVVFERSGSGPGYPTVAVTADSVTFVESPRAGWQLHSGSTYVIGDSAEVTTFRFQKMRLATLIQRPRELLLEAKEPEEMDYWELGNYINLMERANSDVRSLSVERALKLAVPAAALVIALFGAPLAITAPRAGPAFGVAVSLATTVSYILLINLTRAVGASGVIDPNLAAWAPNVLFALLGLVLLYRART